MWARACAGLSEVEWSLPVSQLALQEYPQRTLVGDPELSGLVALPVDDKGIARLTDCTFSPLRFHLESPAVRHELDGASLACLEQEGLVHVSE